MWISKRQYEEMKRAVDENVHDAAMFRRIKDSANANEIIFHSDFVLMTHEAFGTFSIQQQLDKEKLRNVEAELEWYKVKYHEMKMNQDT